MFCQCNIYFWKKNIKLKYHYNQGLLSDIGKIKKECNDKANLLIIDDCEMDKSVNYVVNVGGFDKDNVINDFNNNTKRD